MIMLKGFCYLMREPADAIPTNKEIQRTDTRILFCNIAQSLEPNALGWKVCPKGLSHRPRA